MWILVGFLVLAILKHLQLFIAGVQRLLLFYVSFYGQTFIVRSSFPIFMLVTPTIDLLTLPLPFLHIPTVTKLLSSPIAAIRQAGSVSIGIFIKHATIVSVLLPMDEWIGIVLTQGKVAVYVLVV